ncbi:MAG: hypothetical protein GYA41_00925 [Bacteroidales bacterium]|nr:hypothetical protein [Bacteroidales bacterium]
MGNKPILLPIETSYLNNESKDCLNLSGKYPGKLLFRSHFFGLISGKVAVLDKTGNKYFYGHILDYARDTHDINLLPALRKITTDIRFSESLRQQASELMEIIEEKSAREKHGRMTTAIIDDSSRAENARGILAGVRYPQTTEILRLLRDKSPELRRLALCLIGKFRVKDMIQEVCECLTLPELSEEAFSVLSEFGGQAGKELTRFYLKYSGNLVAGRAILRLISCSCPEENMSFVFERLWTNSRIIRESAAKALIKCGFKPAEEERKQLKKLIYNIFGQITWILSLKVSLDSNNEAFLAEQIEKEFMRWKKFLLDLLFIAYGKSITSESSKRSSPDNYDKLIPELAGILFTDSRTGKKNISDTETDRKILKKLQQYYPCDLPRHEALPEEIINCDYNVLSVWTKACAIRTKKAIADEHLLESVAALLFSPEWILKEEAARLLNRTDSKKFADIIERLSENDRLRIAPLVKEEQESSGELLFEKTRFLSSVFSPINEEKLLFLAERMKFITCDSQEEIKLLPESIIWTITKENQITLRYISDKRTEDVIADFMQAESVCYVLPLTAIELFRFYDPDDSLVICEYLERLEE